MINRLRVQQFALPAGRQRRIQQAVARENKARLSNQLLKALGTQLARPGKITQINELVEVLLAVGTVVLAVGAVTGAVTVLVAGLLLGNILLALCSPESSEYVIVGVDATTAVDFCAGFETNPVFPPLACALATATGLLPVIGWPEALPTCST